MTVGSFFKGLLKGSAVVVILVFVAIAVLWYLDRPRGLLRLAVDASEDDANAIHAIFDSANQNVRDVVRFHNALGLGLKSIATDPVPSEPGPNAAPLVDLVKIDNSSFKFDWRVIKLDGEFKANQILVVLYDSLFGWHDYYLVIRDYSACLNGHPGGPTPSPACRHMAARAWPVDARGVPLQGTPTEIDRDLAVYLFKAFLQAGIDDKRVDRASVLPPSDLSSSFESLDETAQGFDILQSGTSHPTCISSTSDACRKSALELFNLAWSRDRYNAYALLGLGLLRLDDALTLARNQGRFGDVLASLNEAGKALGAARRSAFLADFVANRGNLARFHLIDLHALSVTPKFIESVTNYSRAYRAYVEADYRGQLDAIKNIADIPNEVRPYLKAFEYEARLDLAGSREEAEPLLKELSQIIAATPDSWDLQIVYGSQACRFGLHDIADVSLKAALNSAAHDRVLLNDTYIWQAYCLAKKDQRAEADNLIGAVTRFLADRDGRISDQAIQTIYIDLGYYFASINDNDRAAQSFGQAKMNRCLWERIAHDEQLQSFQNSQAFMHLRDDYSKSLGGSPACNI